MIILMLQNKQKKKLLILFLSYRETHSNEQPIPKKSADYAGTLKKLFYTIFQHSRLQTSLTFIAVAVLVPLLLFVF